MNPTDALYEYGKAISEGKQVFLKLSPDGKIKVKKHGQTWKIFHHLKACFSSDHAYNLQKIVDEIDKLSLEIIPPKGKRRCFLKGLESFEWNLKKYDWARNKVRGGASESFERVRKKNKPSTRLIGPYPATAQEKMVISKIPEGLWHEFLIMRELSPALTSYESQALIRRFRFYLNNEKDQRLLRYTLLNINAYEMLGTAKNWVEQKPDLPD